MRFYDELLECCRAQDLTLGSGHVSWQESMALAKEAHEMGYKTRRSFSGCFWACSTKADLPGKRSSKWLASTRPE